MAPPTRRLINAMLNFFLFAFLLASHHRIVPGVNAINFESRTRWKAEPPKESMPAALAGTRPLGVKIHWTGDDIKLGNSHPECLSQVKRYQVEHINKPNSTWPDLAYNLVVCKHGVVIEGRGLQFRSGANGNQELNRRHYSVLALVGNNKKGDYEPSNAMIQGLKDAIAYLRKKGKARKEIKGHNDGWQTECPGGPLSDLISKGRLEPGKPSKPVKSTSASSYQKFPGTAWFKKKPKSSIITRMGKRLVANKCGAYKKGPGSKWTSADQASYKNWQKKQGYTGAKLNGWPDKDSWDKLKVPKA